MTSRLCLTLTGKSISEDLEILDSQRSYIDMAELRADFLENETAESIASFPERSALPVILTMRRTNDGGKCTLSEDDREAFFEKVLSLNFASKVRFAFVDFEEDFRFEKSERLARSAGIRIIRSAHKFDGPVLNLEERIEQMNVQSGDIAKIAFMAEHLSDVTNLFKKAPLIKTEHILLAMGPYGIPSRILASRLNNYLTFSSIPSKDSGLKSLSHLDPEKMQKLYHFGKISEKTAVFGITGFPLEVTSSPELHNEGYEKNGIDAVYVPVKSETIEETLAFNEACGIKGMSVTIPHKESVMKHLSVQSPDVKSIGACNTIVLEKDGWHGYNTDAPGFARALLAFSGLENLSGKKVSVIGSGGASRAIVYAVKKLGAKACVFNRTVEKAKNLAEKYGFEYCALDEKAREKLSEYSDIFVQTTSKGMSATDPDALPSTKENDPVWFYDFKGTEKLFDIIYHPEITPVMGRAEKSGCDVSNGFKMLQYQGYEQFRLFTGKEY